jgi:hypothetical protein
MVLVSGAAFAHDEAAEGIQVGGYVDARYTWGKVSEGARTNKFSLAEGAVYVGKRVGATRVFIDAGLNAGLNPTATGLSSLTLQQAYVANASDAGFSWKAGRFDGIFGWQPNDSGHYWLSGRGLLQEGLPAYHQGLLFGYNFSDMMSLQVLAGLDNAQVGAVGAATASNASRNMDYPKWGVKLDSKMDAFDLGLGFQIEKADAGEGNKWDLDLVAGTKFADYDFKAIFVMGKENKDAKSTMGFGAQLGGMFTDSLSGVARVEWAKRAEKDTMLAMTVGPQFHLEKGFVVKADYSLMLPGGDANKDAAGDNTEHAINVAAVYDF